MNRFFLPRSQCAGDHLVLAGAEGHHATTVLRVREHERVTILDGEGGDLLCEVSAVSRQEARLRVLHRGAQPPPPARVTLLQALTKGRSMDWIVQKATELGAHRIVPVAAERSVAHVEPGTTAQKLDKWNTTAIEAAKQCGSAWLPRLEAPVTLPDWIARHEPFDLTLVASLQPGARHPRQFFDDFRASHGRRPQTVAVWVGPEGDFTPAEVHQLLAAGALPVTLGPLILRSETAAVYCLSVINYESQAG